MLTKTELIGRLVAHESTTWQDGDASVLQALEERVLEQLLREADQRGQEVPLTPKRFEEMLTSALEKHSQLFEAKLATYTQQAEEKHERAQLIAYMQTQGWSEDEAQTLPLVTLRRIQQTLDPVSYIGQGAPRFAATVDDHMPSDEPDWQK